MPATGRHRAPFGSPTSPSVPSRSRVRAIRLGPHLMTSERQSEPACTGAGDWECPICTCVNPELYLVCDTCACDRPEDGSAESSSSLRRAGGKDVGLEQPQGFTVRAAPPPAAVLPPARGDLTDISAKRLAQQRAQPALGGRSSQPIPAVPGSLRKTVAPPRDWHGTEEALEFLGQSIPNYRIESDEESDEG